MELEDVCRLIDRLAGAETTIVDGIVASRVETEGPPEGSVTGTSFVLMARGSKRMAVGEQVFEYGAGQCLVTSVEVPVMGHFFGVSARRPALGFAMTLRPAIIAELLLESPPSPRGPVPAGIAVADASPDVIDAVGRTVRLIERPQDRAVLGAIFERELHWLALTGPLGPVVRQLGLADSSLSRVGHAVRWIREHYADPFRIEDLARLARMSPSAFHRSFRAITALSPVQYQKRLRLQEARVRLLADPSDIAGAAYAVGYESASQFSREYRRQFGAPPSVDAALLREVGLTST
ncbi:AraC family transcriptional regulator [Xylanimonas oleitrophica]|uniref:AraC family transcriptional regulator n=1 Tax=Xylanimonas oleitrophica TaxID=2607479 RepID=A0A2W5WWJ0_9MICO|nr:AraC family transcriptional regulator [Xylanimonas oleitrophica]PZR55002.1 AraC family transcriptional regulator [Xylanimonas oleitrophica]